MAKKQDSINQQQKYCSSENEKLYLNLFQPRNLGNDDDFLVDFLCLPSVAILCLHFEFILITDPHKMCKFPKFVQKYISVALDAKLDIHEALSTFYFEVPEEFISKEQSAYMLLKEEIRKLCGDEVFYNEWYKLVNLRYSFATGLAPAYSQFMQIRCPGPKPNSKKRGYGIYSSSATTTEKCQEDPLPCGALVYFHTFCYKCARIFDVKSMMPTKCSSTTGGSGSTGSSSSSSSSSSTGGGSSISRSIGAGTSEKRAVESQQKKTAMRAIDVLGKLAYKAHHKVQERGKTTSLGGDLLFLLRNLAVSLKNPTAQMKCQKLLRRWMIAWLVSLDDVDEDNYFDVIKGLQVICKLKKTFYQAGATSLTGPRAKDFERNSSDVDGLAVLFSNRSSAVNDDEERLDEDGNASDDESDLMSTTETIASDMSLTNLMALRAGGRKGSAATASLASQMVGSSTDEKLRKVSMKSDEILRNVRAHLETSAYSEFLDCNYSELPVLTPPVTGNYCGNCGDPNGIAKRKNRVNYSSSLFVAASDRSKTGAVGPQLQQQKKKKQQQQPGSLKGDQRPPIPLKPLEDPELDSPMVDSKSDGSIMSCQTCGFHIQPDSINYAALCDSLVWLYVFQDISLELPGGKCAVDELRKLFRIMPIIRSYKTLEALGENMFKHQCYFITHLIYVFSDYGVHSLKRLLFVEEFIFIVENMKNLIALDDADLVGEFLHCLRVLQYLEYKDSDIREVFQSGLQYLVNKEKALGSKGRFLDRSTQECQDEFSDYHASYCAAVGLLEPAYTEEEVINLTSPVPNILRIF